MIRLALLRHGPTDWNADGRLQGRVDRPLSDAGRLALESKQIPAAYRRRTWFVSPLLRARQTAAALGLQATVAADLIEMDWGTYEGHSLPELRARFGQAFADNEARGLDLLPPGGESPRQVQQRLRAWLRTLKTDCGAVTHKGVIRAIMADALDWPMTGKPPVKLDWRALHDFTIGADGRPQLLAANVALEHP